MEKLKDMTPKETIKHLTTRAEALAGMNEPSEESYWQLMEELFQAQRVWEQEAPRHYWPEAMKDDLTKLSFILCETWQKIINYNRKTMKTKSYMDITAQWRRLHALTFREGTYAESERRIKGWWRVAEEITIRYRKNIIREYDRIHGYKLHRDLWEQFPVSVYAKQV